jgi:hypothetical protein
MRSRHSFQTRRPSPTARSYDFPVWVRGLISAGGFTHASLSKNCASAISEQPIRPCASASIDAPRWIPPSRALSSSTLPTPFASPKVSHASQSDRTEKPAKYPNPAIALYGAFSLKKNGVPTGRFTRRIEGRQKLASFGRGSFARCWYHPGSVMATKPFTRGHRSATATQSLRSPRDRSAICGGDAACSVQHLATAHRISLIGSCTYMNRLIILVSGEGAAGGDTRGRAG